MSRCRSPTTGGMMSTGMMSSLSLVTPFPKPQPATCGLDRASEDSRRLSRSCHWHSNDPDHDRLQRPHRHCQDWSCRQLRPTGWQRYRHPLFGPGADGQAAGTPACAGAESHPRGYSRQSSQRSERRPNIAERWGRCPLNRAANQVLNASTSDEIEAAFARLRHRAKSGAGNAGTSPKSLAA
jgi:hypothetical protein